MLTTLLAAVAIFDQQVGQTDVLDVGGLALVRIGSKVLAVDPPVPIPLGRIANIRPSHDGKRLLIVYRAMTTEDYHKHDPATWDGLQPMSLATWDSFTGDIQKLNFSITGAVTVLGWYSSCDAALISVKQPAQEGNYEIESLYHIDLRTSAQTLIDKVPAWNSYSIAVGPNNLAAVSVTSRPIALNAKTTTRIYVIDVNGKLRQNVQSELYVNELAFNQSGKELYVHYSIEGQSYWSPFKAMESHVTPGQDFQRYDPNSEIEHLYQVGATTETETKFSTVLWQIPYQSSGESKHKEVIMTSNGLDGRIVGEKYIYYTQMNGFAIRRITELPLSYYHNHKRAQVKELAISNARQIGTSGMIFASMNDDKFPLTKDFVESIMPILKDMEMLQGFDYYLNGETVSDIQKITQTKFGVLTTPYGQATIYADSHVEWKDFPDPP